MEDTDLEEIRAQRLAQLQSQYGVSRSNWLEPVEAVRL